MKKCLLIIFILCLFIPPAYAYDSTRLTVSTTLKTTEIPDGVLYIDGNIYLPLIQVSEALGAVVYEKDSGGSCYIISRDGDVITHSAWTYFYEMNDNICYNNLLSINDSVHGILVPCSMVENIFSVNISHMEDGAHIDREMHTNYYSEIISRLMNLCIRDDFYPENFIRYYRYYSNNPWMEPEAVVKNVNIGLDKKNFDDAIVVSTPDARDVLVNKLNRLPDNHSAKNLVSVDRQHVKNTGRSHLLEAEAYSKYAEMYSAAEKEGLLLKIVSSYRTEDYQRSLYNSYLKNYGYAYAEQYSAHPGYSEHQTGLAVDINSLYTSFENSKEYKWLKNHAHEFGFIERYQKGKEYITGYAYEPWHYRYVGTDAAKVIHEQSITYEEYYATYIYNSEYTLNKDRTQTNVLPHFHK